MNVVTKHLQSKFLAGLLAAIPVAITLFVVFYVDSFIQRILPVHTPLVGTLISLVIIYALGLFVTSLVGRYLLRLFDRALTRLPGLRDFYRTWKQLVVAPDVHAGVFARAVLVPDESGRVRMLGFTSGRPIPNSTDTLCVFVPTSPNPVVGRLYFVRMDEAHFLDLPVKEALKMVVSGGNYVPEAIGTSLARP
jgi:uncharacterized membrane protein